MFREFDYLEKLFRNKSFNIQNPYLNKIIKAFDFVCLTEHNYKTEIQKRKNKNKIITIDCYLNNKTENDNEYFIFCFEKIIFVINLSDKLVLEYFLSYYSGCTIYCVSYNVKRILEKNQIKISVSDPNQSSFINNEIDFFNLEFECEKYLDDREISKVKRCIAGYLIKKAYHKSNINRITDSINELKLTDKNQTNPIDKYIRINQFNATATVILAFNIELEQLFILKNHQKDDEQEKLNERELNNYKNLEHRFIPRLYEDFIVNDEHKTPIRYLIIEYIKGRTLKDYNFNNFTEIELMNIIFEIMITIHYINIQGYVYRDVKGDNIIIDSFNTAILIDFDRLVNEQEKIASNEFTGDFSTVFQAPEISDIKNFSKKVDVYSLGSLIEDTFLSLDNLDDDTLSKLKIMVKYCLFKDKNDRPTISQIIRYFYLNILSKYDKKQGIEEKLIQIFESNFENKKFIDTDGLCTLGIIFYEGIYVSKNIDKSIKYFSEAANQNDLLSIINLFSIYSDDDYFNEEKIIDYLTIASNLNDPFAQFCLGLYSYFSPKIKQDIKKCIHYLKLASDQNFIPAIFYLGFAYSKIPDVINIHESIRCFETILKFKNPEKPTGQEFYNYHGNYILPNPEIIIPYEFPSVKNYFIASLGLLSIIYRTGNLIQRDIDKSIFYLKKISDQKLITFDNFFIENQLIKKNISNENLRMISAIKNEINFLISIAPCLVGRFYLDGLYLPIDIPRAIDCFKYYADQNNSLAQCYLSYIYSSDIYGRFDILEATKYYLLFKKPSDNNVNDFIDYISSYMRYLTNDMRAIIEPEINNLKMMISIIPNNLGDIFYSGIHVERDINKAIYYYKLSANKQNPIAHYNLGLLYYESEFVKRDNKKAIHHFTISAKLDHHCSQYYLGLIYYNGKITRKDINLAMYYFYCAAKRNVLAQFYLGVIFYICKDIKRDIKLAIHYFKLSSSFCFSYSKNNLGIIYKYGEGDEQNIDYSLIYLNEAVELNNEAARFNLAHIYFFGYKVEQDLDKSIELLISPTTIDSKSCFQLLCLAIIQRCQVITIGNINDVLIKCNPNCDASLAYKIYNEIVSKNLTDDLVECQVLYNKIKSEEYVYIDHLGNYMTRNSIEQNYQKQNESMNKKIKCIGDLFYKGFYDS